MRQQSLSSLLQAPTWNLYQESVDRVTFFEEQKRNRRATWRLTAACAFALFAVGVPLSLVLSPLLYASALVLLNSVHLFIAIPDALATLQGLGTVAFSVFDYLAGEPTAPASLSGVLPGLAVWFIPGIVGITLIWFGVYTLFQHAGVGGIVMSLGARVPNPRDLEEQQLCNVVEEMALAAGVPPPRVLLLDTPVINAAAVGTSPTDATVIISRRLLDDCDRDETQGVIGHLIGSIGNGDLRILFLMISVLLTFGTLVTLLRAPFGPSGRAAFFKLLRLGRKSRRRELDAQAETELLKTLITEGLELEGPDDFDALSQKQGYILLTPFVLVNLSVRWTLFILIPGLLTPLLALLWRKRRYLADATAVQLTRNPSGVARALLAMQGEVLPGSQGVAHVFMSGPAGAETITEFLHWQGIGFHPSRGRRLERLHALGANVQEASERRTPMVTNASIFSYLGTGLLGILLLVSAVTCLAAMVLFVFISLFFMAMFLGMIHGVFALLALLQGWALA